MKISDRIRNRRKGLGMSAEELGEKLGKNRIVPFPDKIVGLIKRRYEQAEKYLIERNGKKISVDYYRKHIFKVIKKP